MLDQMRQNDKVLDRPTHPAMMFIDARPFQLAFLLTTLDLPRNRDSNDRDHTGFDLVPHWGTDILILDPKLIVWIESNCVPNLTDCAVSVLSRLEVVATAVLMRYTLTACLRNEELTCARRG